jgi:hypothetical protein
MSANYKFETNNGNITFENYTVKFCNDIEFSHDMGVISIILYDPVTNAFVTMKDSALYFPYMSINKVAIEYYNDLYDINSTIQDLKREIYDIPVKKGMNKCIADFPLILEYARSKILSGELTMKEMVISHIKNFAQTYFDIDQKNKDDAIPKQNAIADNPDNPLEVRKEAEHSRDTLRLKASKTNIIAEKLNESVAKANYDKCPDAVATEKDFDNVSKLYINYMNNKLIELIETDYKSFLTMLSNTQDLNTKIYLTRKEKNKKELHKALMREFYRETGMPIRFNVTNDVELYNNIPIQEYVTTKVVCCICENIGPRDIIRLGKYYYILIANNFTTNKTCYLLHKSQLKFDNIVTLDDDGQIGPMKLNGYNSLKLNEANPLTILDPDPFIILNYIMNS